MSHCFFNGQKGTIELVIYHFLSLCVCKYTYTIILFYFILNHTYT